jgi:predicted transcriptional regulator
MNIETDKKPLSDNIKELRAINRQLQKLIKEQQSTNKLMSELIILCKDLVSASGTSDDDTKRTIIREVYKVMAEIDPILSKLTRE